jgi:hypothetical protein
MAYNLSAFAGAGAQFFDSNGVPLAGGLLYVYTAGTTTPATTWTTSSGAVANTNPIVMNAAGRTPYEIWLNSGVTYKFALYTSTNVLIGTYDNIPAIDDPTVFNNLITVTGTNDLIGTSVPPYTSYVAGMTLSFIPVATNTGAVTIDIDGLGAKNIFVGNASALTGSELVAGQIANLEYDGTRFQLFTSAIANDAVTTAKIANDAVTTAKIANASVTPEKLSTGAPIWDINSRLGVNVSPGYQLDVAISNPPRGIVAEISNIAAAAQTGAQLTFLQNDIAYWTIGQPAGVSGFVIWRDRSASMDGTEVFRVDNSNNLRFNSGYGSSAIAFGCRAWVNFNGTGTVAIRASGNVSSITDNGTGDYTVNFTTAMPDANYSTNVTGNGTSSSHVAGLSGVSPTTTSVRVLNIYPGIGLQDASAMCAAVFR